MKQSARTRRSVLAAMAGLLSLTWIGCHGDSSNQIVGSTVVYGSGVIAEETRSIPDFTDVVMAGLGNVSIQQGAMTSLRVRAEDNLMEYLETEASGGTLMIRTRTGYDIEPSRQIEFELVVPDLRRVQHSGVGDFSGLSISGTRLVLARSGVGRLEFSGLDVTALEVNLSGVGQAQIEGAADRQSVVLGGVGGYDAGGLYSAEAAVTITSAASATVRVSDRLDARIDGSGSVYYIGNPVVTKTGSGSGSVVPVGG